MKRTSSTTRTRSCKHTSLAFALTALSLAACDVSTDGANGLVAFTPDDCGRIACTFDDSVGVGGKLNLNIAGTEGVSTAGATVVSDSPELLSVVAIADVNRQPTWELQGLAAGVARLTVLDTNDEELDFLEVPIQELSGLTAENFVGDAVGPADDEVYDMRFTVNADQAVSFQISPVIGDGYPAMGRYEYTATIDATIEDTLIEDNLSEGYLYFTPTAGEHVASFENDFGQAIDLLIVAEPSAGQ